MNYEFCVSVCVFCCVEFGMDFFFSIWKMNHIRTDRKMHFKSPLNQSPFSCYRYSCETVDFYNGTIAVSARISLFPMPVIFLCVAVNPFVFWLRRCHCLWCQALFAHDRYLGGLDTNGIWQILINVFIEQCFIFLFYCCTITNSHSHFSAYKTSVSEYMLGTAESGNAKSTFAASQIAVYFVEAKWNAWPSR